MGFYSEVKIGLVFLNLAVVQGTDEETLGYGKIGVELEHIAHK